MIDPQIVDELDRGKVEIDRDRTSPGSPRGSPRSSAKWPKGRPTRRSPASLRVSERAVEKHTNSIFSKLGLTEEKDVNRRVKAVLVYLSDPAGG